MFPVHVVRHGPQKFELPYSESDLNVTYSVGAELWNTEKFMVNANVAGLLVLQYGRILLERYALGFDENSRWTSMSVAKSITSTLIGAAIRDGHIRSIDDTVSRYLPGLKGTVYEPVTIREILNMSSGVKWTEDYTDPQSDSSSFANATNRSRGSTLVTYMAKLQRQATPGTKWVYNTGETSLAGEIVMAATGRSLADYLSERIWSTFGMEHDAFWIIRNELEIGGCCLSISLRDYGRFGLFFHEWRDRGRKTNTSFRLDPKCCIQDEGLPTGAGDSPAPSGRLWVSMVGRC